jgi:predicted nucleic acid-binding Zn ribbon protein
VSADPPADPPPGRPDDPLPDRSGDAPAGSSGTEPHDPVGGDLARAVAHAYRGTTRASARRKRSRKDRGADSAQVSGAAPDDRDPQALSRAMSRLVAEHGWSTDLAVHGVFGRWETIVGSQVAAHCRPARFVDGRLTVSADSTAWATETRLLAPMVLRRLNDELGDGTVTRIEVEGPQTPSWRHGKFSVRDARGPRDTYG